MDKTHKRRVFWGAVTLVMSGALNYVAISQGFLRYALSLALMGAGYIAWVSGWDVL